MALLHLSNQFMYHMTISGNCWAFFFHSFIYLFIFSPHGGEKRWRQKMKYKLEINFKIYVFSIFRFGNWWTVIRGLKEKNEWLIRPSTDHHVLNVIAQPVNGSIWLLSGKKATCRDLWSWNGIIYDWSVDILLRKSLYHIASSARGQDEVNPVFWLATWAGMMGPPSPARDSPYWCHVRKLTKFVTFGQCRHIHRKK